MGCKRTIMNENRVYNGSDSEKAYGAALINGNAVVNGIVDSNFDLQIANDIFDSHAKYMIRIWKQL